MTIKRRKGYDSKFKAEVAMAALNGTKSLIEIGAEHKISKTAIIEWRDKLINGATELFMPVHEREKRIRLLQQEIDTLHKIVGEVTIENSFLKKKLLR